MIHLIALLVYFLNIIGILLSIYKNFKLFKYEIHFKLHIRIFDLITVSKKTFFM